MLKIDFYHDVICSFCFPMSAKMRRIAEKYNNLEINHKSFALGWEEEDFIRAFGSREAVKPEVLNHWEHANQVDDEHRFNILGMRKQDFYFPLSKNALIASKAVGRLMGEVGYWDAFDLLQDALFVQNKNIEDYDVIKDILKEQTDLDLAEWDKMYEDPETEKLVLMDLDEAHRLGINSAPTIVIADKYVIPGAQPLSVIENALIQISKKEDISLNKLETLQGLDGEGACHLIDGDWKCD